MDYLSYLKTIGDKSGDILSLGVSLLSQATPSKIFGILVLALIGFFSFKFIESGFKWLIAILIVLLIFSLGVSIVL